MRHFIHTAKVYCRAAKAALVGGGQVEEFGVLRPSEAIRNRVITDPSGFTKRLGAGASNLAQSNLQWFSDSDVQDATTTEGNRMFYEGREVCSVGRTGFPNTPNT